jgi:hypothetical protein
MKNLYRILPALALVMLSASSFAQTAPPSTQLITRFGLRCSGPFKSVSTGISAHGIPSAYSVGQNYQPAGIDPNFSSLVSHGDGTATVTFKPKASSVSVAVEQGTDNITIKSSTPNSVTLAIGTCEMNSVVVLLLSGVPQ